MNPYRRLSINPSARLDAGLPVAASSKRTMERFAYSVAIALDDLRTEQSEVSLN